MLLKQDNVECAQVKPSKYKLYLLHGDGQLDDEVYKAMVMISISGDAYVHEGPI
jgi:hypothetical protein